MADREFDPNVEVDQLRHDIRTAEAQLDAGEGVEHDAAREQVLARLLG